RGRYAAAHLRCKPGAVAGALPDRRPVRARCYRSNLWARPASKRNVQLLRQNNTDVAIPLLISSKGYGIFWNTASFSYVDNRFPLDLKFQSMAGDQVD